MKLGRHIREGFIGVLRHSAMSISAATAVTITLLLVSLFLLLTLNIQQITKNVEESVQIHVKILESAGPEVIAATKTEIAKLTGVRQVTFSDKNAELDRFIAAFGADGKIFEMYRGENNPLRNAYLVDVQKSAVLDVLAAKIKVLDGIESVNYGGENTLRLVAMMDSLSKGGLMLVSILSLLAIFLISNTIKITIYARSVEIYIMRTLGATNHFIRFPFLIEGILIGLLGSILPILITVFGYQYLYQSMSGVLFTNLFILRPVFPMVYQVSGILAGLAVLVGLTGSFISVTRHLRWNR
ncbi:MAG: ABC transporter permease [Erysipelotrichales bacterium]|nr:MAG: ABC transporter permease [Erysipelotrichales bacterium]